MRSNNSYKKEYILFIDESGESHLNHSGQYFFLSTVIIDKNDFPIVEGYLRLLKRSFLGEDLKNIHMTDLCERTYQKYRRLCKPVNRINSFLNQLSSLVSTIPFNTGIYYMDKDAIRQKLNYTPAPKKNIQGVDMNLAYQLTAKEAFYNFSDFLVKEKAHGEIIVESRFARDADLINYFDEVRQKRPNSPLNHKADNIHKLINSVTISNKRMVDGGLELADIGAYCTNRNYNGDPQNLVKVPMGRVIEIFNRYKKKSYLKTPNNKKIGVQKIIY